MPHLRSATISNEVLPVVCGSALKHVGTQLLLDYVGELFPSPLDVPHEAQTRTSPVRALAWKVTWDAKRGWMTFVRVYSGVLLWLHPRSHPSNHDPGKLTKQSGLFNASRNRKEKAGKLMLLYASEAQEVDELPMGSVGVVLGLKHTRTGDTLVSMGANSEQRTALRDITPPPAVVSTSVIPQSHSDLEPVQQALDALTRTDPSVRVDVQEGQLVVQGLGTLHLEIVENKLRSEWNVNFEFGQRRVSYREGMGMGEPQENWDHWSGEVNGKPASVVIPVEIRPMEEGEVGDPVWDGNLVIGPRGKPLPSPESISTSRLAAIGDGLATALSNSPHYSLPLTKVYVKVNELPKDIGVSIATLNTATVAVVRNRIRSAGPGPILEPYVHVKISVPEKSFGNVINDLTENGGELLEMGEDSSSGFDGSEASAFSDEGVYVPPAWVSPSGSYTGKSGGQGTVKHVIHASAPLKQMFDYSNRLRAIAEGHGNFEMTVDGFKDVSEARCLEILKEIGRA
jgi:elongation factor G